MKDIKPTIAKNLAFFRKQSGLTQAELAEKLNYSDKAVSRWEHGDTLPDINVLYQLCDFYAIDMNTLISEDADLPPQNDDFKKSLRFRISIYGLAVSFVWILATIIFIYSGIINGGNYFWLAFVWALPASCFALLISSCGMKVHVFRLVINSVSIWTLLTSVFLTAIELAGHLLWPIYLMGIPLQIIVVMAFIMRKR